MSAITPQICRISFAKESSFRDGGGSGAALTYIRPFDLTREIVESIDIPEPIQEIVKEWTNQTRNLGRVKYLGYKPGESSWSFEAVVSIMLYYALGACTTTGATAPYTHAITESDTLPSFALHIEQELSGDSIRMDLLGCIVKSLELVIEAGSDTPVMMNVDLIVAKVVAGSDLIEPASLGLEKFTRANVSTFTLLYNTVAIESDLLNQTQKIAITITNDIDMESVLNDDYANKVKVGKREYEIKLLEYIRNSTWRSISKLKVPNYSADYGTKGADYSVAKTDVILSGGGTTSVVLTTGLTGYDTPIGALNILYDEDGSYYKIVSYTALTKTLVLTSAGPANGKAVNLYRATHYTGDIDLILKVARSATDYIQLTFDKIGMDPEFTNKLISWDEKELAIDLPFFVAPGGSLAVESKDKLDAYSYETKPIA